MLDRLLGTSCQRKQLGEAVIRIGFGGAPDKAELLFGVGVESVREQGISVVVVKMAEDPESPAPNAA
jgi:hypothetical protein